jgi:hypothetical protein
MLYKPTYEQIAAGAYRNHPRYQGCFGHWLMNEGGGLSAYNVSDYRSNGTLTSGATWSSGLFGPTVLFNGTGSHISAPTVGSSPTTISISAWARSTLGATSQDIFTALGDKISLRWSFSGGGPALLITTAGGTFIAQSATSLTAAQWYFFTGTYDGETVRLYLNGVEVGADTAATGTITSYSGSMIIGIHANLASNPFNGVIDDVRVYTRALSADEVRSLYLDPFIEFRPPRRQRSYLFTVPTGPPAGSLALLGCGR